MTKSSVRSLLLGPFLVLARGVFALGVVVLAGACASDDGSTVAMDEASTAGEGAGGGGGDVTLPSDESGGDGEPAGGDDLASGDTGGSDPADDASAGGEPAGDGEPADDAQGGDGTGEPAGDDGSGAEPDDGDGAQTPPEGAPDFSFFITSLAMIRELSGSEDGFGGNFGGLAGADEICQKTAESVGVGYKTWRAFLSATSGPDGEPVHAIERIGEGPWHDANGRLIATGLEGLVANDRPDGDPQAVDDMVDENGEPLSVLGDVHDIPTGSDAMGRLNSTDPASTCNDWTDDSDGTPGVVMCGHSFPRDLSNIDFGNIDFGDFDPSDFFGDGGAPFGDGASWVSDHPLRGCAPGVNTIQNGPGTGTCIGCSGGYGGLYCFALEPVAE